MTNTDINLIVALSPFGTLLLSAMGWALVKLSKHDTALALLIQQVMPAGEKSLRVILQEIKEEQIRTNANLPPTPPSGSQK